MNTTAIDPVLTRRFHSMRRLIGNTPLLALELRVNGEPRTIYAKYEPLNLTGSGPVRGSSRRVAAGLA